MRGFEARSLGKLLKDSGLLCPKTEKLGDVMLCPEHPRESLQNLSRSEGLCRE